MELTHDEITRLSPDERLALIAQLWDSLDDQLQLTPSQLAELERRLATLDQDRAQSVTWETLKAELERRCPECSLFFSLRPRARNSSRRKTGNEVQAPGLGRLFRAEIDSVVQRMADNPRQFPVVFS